MGGIACITPASAIALDQRIPKVTEVPSAESIGRIGMIPLKMFEKIGGTGLRTILVEDVERLNPMMEQEISFSTSDMLWMYAKFAGVVNVPGWRGFMEIVTKNNKSEQTRIMCLPFINSPPSNYDTIHTTLHLAVEESRKIGQKTTFVTFDQPLYVKARDILAGSKEDVTLSNVVIRLGGFHLLMSYLGTIGYIMGGSGLKELLSIIYAPISVDKMLTGHAYSRAVRGHLLVQLALASLIFEEIEFSDEDRATVQDILHNFKDDSPTLSSINENLALKALREKLRDELKKLERNGATAKLWVQYFLMVNLMKNFIEAERSGDWNSHLNTVQKMLPFFHASGHLPYAKSGQMYLQDMLNLESKMDPEEYNKFVKGGYFTIRRTSKFWSGTWSDMTIEQSLMRPFSVHGGLTRGRGYSESVQCRWVLGMPATHDICEAVEEYCGISFVTSEQHVDCRDSRISRDNKDVTELKKWLSLHPPFPIQNEIVSLSTGVVGDDKINCYNAVEVGRIGIEQMIGNNFKDIKMKRTNRVLPLAAVNSAIKIHDVLVPIDPLLLFHRMAIKKESDEQLAVYLQYELTPFPLSLFNESGMLKTKKSALYDIFAESEEENIDCVHVIDGGFLLHRVLWHQNQTFLSICANYIAYVRKHYGSDAIIVFDGYSNSTGNTKKLEQQRRALKGTSAAIHFDENMTATVPQDKLLANEKNKVRLIAMLSKHFENEGFIVKQAINDADTLIIQTAIEMSSPRKVTVVGEDVDLLILLIALAPADSNIFFIKPGRGSVDRKVYSIWDLQTQTKLKSTILFLHAFGGCDTTSCLFRQGKLKCFKVMKDQPNLRNVADTFNNTESTCDDIALAGERFFLALYGAPATETSLNKHRYNLFAKSATRRKVDLGSLPPTEAAARQHSLRVYHQVQSWSGNEKCPEIWGWQKKNNVLVPVPTTQAPAPDSLLSLISCNCKKGCTASCGCRKAGLKCSVICGYCHGVSCLNIPCYMDGLEKPDSNEDTLLIPSDMANSVDDPDDTSPFTLLMDCDE